MSLDYLTQIHKQFLTPTQFCLFSGILICPELPWIAVTPDRLAIDSNNNIFPVEIKCPTSCKDGKIKACYLDYLEEDDEGKLRLSEVGRGPQFMFQVQMQIFLSKSEKGFLFIYTEQDQKTIEINLSKALI